MIGKKSPHIFVSESYNRSDDWAISKIKEYIISKGYEVKKKDSEDFSVDIIAKKNNKIQFFEVETKTGYTFSDEDSFSFDTVSFLGRKKKWAHRGFLYVIICRETGAFLICNSKVIYQEKYAESIHINSSERKGIDNFYRVPKSECRWYNLNS